VVDALEVTSIVAVVESLATLEWSLCAPTGYVKNMIPISASFDHDAWGISWAEVQHPLAKARIPH
jgi:homoserine O-acetyltransferase